MNYEIHSTAHFCWSSLHGSFDIRYNFIESLCIYHVIYFFTLTPYYRLLFLWLINPSMKTGGIFQMFPWKKTEYFLVADSVGKWFSFKITPSKFYMPIRKPSFRCQYYLHHWRPLAVNNEYSCHFDFVSRFQEVWMTLQIHVMWMMENESSFYAAEEIAVARVLRILWGL